MTALVQAEQDGDRLSADELLAMAFLLLVAGHETTVHLIGGGVLALLEAPEQKARLTADWSLLPSAVEELLRFVCPVQVSKPRYVSRDLEFHGRSLHRGDIVIPMLASANADPARFDEPERLDIDPLAQPARRLRHRRPLLPGRNWPASRRRSSSRNCSRASRTCRWPCPPPRSGTRARFGIRALTALPVRLT